MLDVGNMLQDEVDLGTPTNALSYKKGVTGEKKDDNDARKGLNIMQEDLWEMKSQEERLRTEEHKYGEYNYPEFILSTMEEQKISRSWRNRLIVNVLGRIIGHKTLENRLQQMWDRQGILNIADLRQEFYLITFTREED